MSRDFPILMSPTSVRGLVRGLKTETRRLMSSPLAKLNVGDRLWVKETFVAPDYLKGTNPKNMLPSTRLIFPATHPSWNAYWTKTSSLFMPKHLSRLTLEITAIWREDLQDLTEIGARREGVAQYAWLNAMTTWKSSMCSQASLKSAAKSNLTLTTN